MTTALPISAGSGSAGAISAAGGSLGDRVADSTGTDMPADSAPASASPRRAHGIPWLARLVLVAAPIAALSQTGWEPMRRVETRAAAALAKAIGANIELAPAGALVAVRRPGHQFFIAEVTASCSGIVAALIVLALGMLITRAGWLRSLGAVAAGVVLAVSLNLTRIAITFLLGSRYGRSGFFLAHDWFGTLITLFAVGVSLLLVVKVGKTSKRHTAPTGAGMADSGASNLVDEV